MGKFIHLSTCNQVLSTYDVSHVINFTRLSPFLSIFVHAQGESGNEANGFLGCMVCTLRVVIHCVCISSDFALGNTYNRGIGRTFEEVWL